MFTDTVLKEARMTEKEHYYVNNITKMFLKPNNLFDNDFNSWHEFSNLFMQKHHMIIFVSTL